MLQFDDRRTHIWPKSPSTRLARLPGLISEDLGSCDGLEISGGGTPARVFKVLADGQWIVVKTLDADRGLVDGHDLNSFLLKPRQIAEIKGANSVVGAHYSEVLAVWQEPGWAGYAMPYYQGATVSELLSTLPFFRMTSLLRDLLALMDNAWSVSSFSAPNTYIRDTHIDRVNRRISLLQAELPMLVSDSPVWVNGYLCRPWEELSAELVKRLEELLQPTLIAFPGHGDLNLGNIIVEAREPLTHMRILDPRGTLNPLDVTYDLAKIMFSIATYDSLMRGGVWMDGSSPSIRVGGVKSSAPRLELAASLGELVLSLPLGQRLLLLDPLWQFRTLFALAIHHLAEAACRLSDADVTRAGPKQPKRARYLSAILWCIGLALVEELLRVDPATTSIRDFVSSSSILRAVAQ